MENHDLQNGTNQTDIDIRNVNWVDAPRNLQNWEDYFDILKMVLIIHLNKGCMKP